MEGFERCLKTDSLYINDFFAVWLRTDWNGTRYTWAGTENGDLVLASAALTVRLYGVTGKKVKLFAENNLVSFMSLQQFTD